ncbi:MAG: tryptophan synthase subunit alpha [Phycisphaerae bacterium]|nr:tryptophan synthase subunit alpha [Phycisphaerae bacterium]
MNRLENKFEELKKLGQKALVGYLTAGDPDIETSKKILVQACKAGLDVLELGVAFSDPVSDGPVIQKAAHRAIANGITLEKTLGILKYIRQEEIDIPVVIFSYYNPIIAYGIERFANDAKAAGADGVLVVDLPFEHSNELDDFLDDSIALIPLVAPTTGEIRMKKICEAAKGFIYMISRVGVTGGGKLDVKPIAEHVAMVRKFTDKPVSVGFGVSTADDVKALGSMVEGIVVGSAFVRIIEENGHSHAIATMVAAKVSELKEATK